MKFEMKKFYHSLFVVVFLLVFSACKKEEIIEPYEPTYEAEPYSLKLTHNHLPAPNLPANNELTVSKVQLGRMLFYEKKLSKGEEMNCASCHIQLDGFSDLNQFSTGVDGIAGERQAMAIFNLAWNNNGFFWDGRSENLQHQALMPVKDPIEMNESVPNVISKLSQDTLYVHQFKRAFSNGEINETNISKALEAFMLSIVSDNSKYDRYLAGQATLTASEERGRELFFTEYNEFFPELSGADCIHCHSGANFENDLYMNNGLDADIAFTDYGREDVTGDPNDRAKFKVTSLRNIAVTPPYMHDGRFNTLEEVVDHYNDEITSSSTLDPALEMTMNTGLMLTAQDKADLVAFMKTLTDESFLTNPAYASPF